MKQSKKRILIEIFISTLLLLLGISSVVCFLLGIWLESKKFGLTGCLALMVICLIALSLVGLNNEEKF